MTKNNELIWIGGKHAVLSYLKSKCKDVVEFRTSHSNLKENLNNKIKANLTTSKEIDKIFKDSNFNHQGYALLIKRKETLDFKNLIKNNRLNNKVIILEDIFDPGNLGAIIRNCVAFDFTDIILKKNQKILNSPFFFKSTVGTVLNSRIIFTSNISNAILGLKKNGYWIYGSSLNRSKLINQVDFEENKYAILFGSEGIGLKEKTIEKCDELFNIPMLNDVESLNVASSVAITLYSIQKKRPA